MHDRRPIPAHVRETFDELSGQARIDTVVDRLYEMLGLLEREALPLLEVTRREPAALGPLLRHELASERLRAAASPGDRLYPLLRRVRRVAFRGTRVPGEQPRVRLRPGQGGKITLGRSCAGALTRPGSAPERRLQLDPRPHDLSRRLHPVD